MSSLSNFIVQQFEDWKKNRQALQDEANENIEIFQRKQPKWKKDEGRTWRSNATLGIGKQKIVSAVSLLEDSIMQGGRIPFSLRPKAELREHLQLAPPEIQTAVRREMEMIEAQISDMLSMTKSDREARRSMLCAGILGESYDKFVVDVQADGRPLPAWRHISWWNIFRDWESNRIEEGSGIIQREFVSAYWLRQRMSAPRWNVWAIERVLSAVGNDTRTEADNDDSVAPALRSIEHRQNRIRVLEYWGRVPRAKFESYIDISQYENGEAPPAEGFVEEDKTGDDVYVMALVAGNGGAESCEVVKIEQIRPDDIPFTRWVWEENLDEIGGIGVAANVRPTTNAVNSLLRSIMDSSYLASCFIVAVKESLLHNPKDINEGLIKGVLKLLVTEGSKSANEAVQQIIFQNPGSSLIPLMQNLERLLDDDSLVPKLSQGIKQRSIETAYEISQRLTQAGKYLGMVSINFDDGAIEPMIGKFYRFLAAKNGQQDLYQVEARGFATFYDRMIGLSNLKDLIMTAGQIPPMAARLNFDMILQKLAKFLNTDPDEYLKPYQTGPTIEEQQAQHEMLMRQQEVQADLGKKMSDAEAKLIKARASQDLASAKMAEVEAKIEAGMLQG